MNEQIIAVDFDGTLCENKWPEIGEPNTAIQTVLNDKGKIEFHISIAADQEVFEELDERYKILIS